MPFLTQRAYWKLLYFEFYILCRNFSGLHSKVRHFPLRDIAPSPGTIEAVSAAVDMACVWYWKEVLCLQRSAVTACLLKQCGVRAEMVIGAQQMPFKAHAWVEVAGRVVNDKPYAPETYVILDRC
jgi:hypothetical protein